MELTERDKKMIISGLSIAIGLLRSKKSRTASDLLNEQIRLADAWDFHEQVQGILDGPDGIDDILSQITKAINEKEMQ
jgi:hypothetical protein